MSRGFRDTFTKDSEQEELLGYDDAAFYYFACSILGIVVVPWTISFVKSTACPSRADNKDAPGKSKAGSTYRYCQTTAMVDKDSKAKRSASSGRFDGSWFLQLLVISSIWLGMYLVVTQLGQETEIKSFDPFAILEVTSSDSASDIKKAYRKLSLIYHPDKNPDDPLAASRFIQITKAYAALTDEVAKKNYELYGNPDGPQTSKVGIGLPRFLLEKKNHVLILFVFFFFLLFLVPMVAICYWQRTRKYAANGVLIETLQFMEYYTNESTRLKNCPEMLAASAESRAMQTRASDEKAMKEIAKEVVEHKKRQWPNHPVITRNSFLLLAHMQRLHHHLTPELRADLDELLRHSLKITQAMIDLACWRNWLFTAQSIIDFRRCLIQALDVKSSQLLQIPHFDEEVLRHCHKGKNAVASLENFVQSEPEKRKGLSNMGAQQLADIEAFASHVSQVDVKAAIDVEDEEDLVLGDVATVHVQLTRTNLRENEAAGPVHAPLFPETKFEEWYLFLVESSASSAPALVGYERLRDTDQVVDHTMRFQLTKKGKCKVELHAMCDSYVGLDRKIELSYTVLSDDEAKREIIIHREDEELDLQPTLFQQMIGDFSMLEEEESEDEAEFLEGKQKAGKAGKAKGEKGKDDGARGGGGDDEGAESGADAAGGGDGGASSASSDSDSE